MKNLKIDDVVRKLGLKKLWNEDYIKEDYFSDIVFSNNNISRPLFNWAYYLIPSGCIFPLHKLLSDESWQFCLGGAVDLHLIIDNKVKTVRIGPDILNDDNLLYIVKKETWFAATPAPGSEFSLITHCVSPGWIPAEDIPGYYEDMIQLAPENKEFIEKFSWPKSRKSYVMHDDYKT